MIIDELTELNEILERLTTTAEKFWKDRCVEIVRRNSELSLLLHNDAEGMRTAIRGMLMRNIDRDAFDEMVFSGIEADVWGCRGIVDHAADMLSKGLEMAQGERQATHASTLDLKRKVDALLARRREHAINSPDIRAKVWSITEGRCIWCDVELTRERDPNNPCRCFVVDHLVAKANGGPDHLSNYVPSCAKCNGAKATRPWFEFLRRHQPGLRVVGGSDA
jgi:hypothetical protein